MARFGDLPFPLGAGIISAVTVGAIGLAIALNSGPWWPAAFVVPIVVAVWYLVGYSSRPGPRSVRPTEEEPFEDPVEEADRVAQERGSAGVGAEDSEAGAPPGAATDAPPVAPET